MPRPDSSYTNEGVMETITLTKTCPFCGSVNTIEVDAQAYTDWQNGEYIQNAFPTLSADDMEIIKTGICSCWP